MRKISGAAVAIAALSLHLADGNAAVAAVGVDGDAVLYWSQVALANYSGSPVTTSRGFAMLGVGLHDAVNAAQGGPNNSYLGISTAGGDVRAAASVAARDILVHLNAGATANFDAALAASLAQIADGQAKTDGMATGAAIAAAVIANRTGDGSATPGSYAPTGLPGNYVPTPPANLPAALPNWENVTPWLLSSGDQFRASPPPALDSAEYAAAFNAVKAIGSAGSLTRTQDQSDSANFWVAASGTGPWIQAAIDLSQTQGLSTLENASMMAMLGISVADAVIGIWDSKYEYDYWRPVTAIRRADEDGNAATEADINWTPYIVTPNHPSYISGHSGVAGAASTVLDSFLGDTTSFSLTYGGIERDFGSFQLAAEDAANSRLWGGIHWDFDNAAGLTLGRSVGAYTLNQSTFGAVPEPATWAMMIAGFGAVGQAMRRRGRPLPQAV